MFDSGFSELMLIMIVALIVVGPERLPGLARKAGYWVGKFRRYINNVRSEIERELNADELRNMLTKQEDEIRELRDMLQDTRSQIRNELDDITGEVSTAGEQLHENLTQAHEGLTQGQHERLDEELAATQPHEEEPATGASSEPISSAVEEAHERLEEEPVHAAPLHEEKPRAEVSPEPKSSEAAAEAHAEHEEAHKS